MCRKHSVAMRGLRTTEHTSAFKCLRAHATSSFVSTDRHAPARRQARPRVLVGEVEVARPQDVGHAAPVKALQPLHCDGAMSLAS